MVQPSLNAAALNGTELSANFTAALQAMDASLKQAEQALGNGRSVSHLVLGPMKIAQWRRFHLAHARHHLKQIAAIRRQF
jgi:hypothetical protein